MFCSKMKKKTYIKKGDLHLSVRKKVQTKKRVKKRVQTGGLIFPSLIIAGLTAPGSLFGKGKKRKYKLRRKNRNTIFRNATKTWK